MKRVLITGATGFVGANLARRLVFDGHSVHLVVRPGYQGWRIDDLKPAVEIHSIDLADAQETLATVAAIQPEWIFHMATYGAYASQKEIRPTLRTNVDATINLVEACLETGFEAFINTGSSSEYGFKDHAPDEQEWLEPNSLYAITKSFATQYCRYIAQSRRAALTTLRLYSIYGPYEEPTRLIPTLVVYGLQGRLPNLVNPAIARDFVYVDDAVEACLLAAEWSQAGAGEVYNVGSGVQTTIAEAVETTRRLFHLEVQPDWGSMPDRAWDNTTWVSNPARIRAGLGWTARTSFAGGLARFCAWLQAEPELLAYYRSQIL